MYFTGQKTGMIPLFLLIIFLVFSNLKMQNLSKLLTTGIIVISTFGYIVYNYLNLSFARMSEGVVSRFSRLSSIISRLELKLKATELFAKNPFFGRGQDGYQFTYGMDNPHDWNFQVLCETGLIGIVFYLMILYNILFQIQKNNGKKIMYLFGLIYLIISSAGGNNFTVHTFWVSAAFIISYLELNRMKSIEHDLLNV